MDDMVERKYVSGRAVGQINKWPCCLQYANKKKLMQFQLIILADAINKDLYIMCDPSVCLSVWADISSPEGYEVARV